MRQPVNITFMHATLAVLLLICASPCPAQQQDDKPNDSSAGIEWKARLFDVYRNASECDEKARLDNFAIELQASPTLKGCLIYYDGKNDLPASTGSWQHLRALDYLANIRQLDQARIVALHGGFREEQAMELWIVPEGVATPEPTNTIPAPTFAGQTYKFDAQTIEFIYEEPENVSEPESVEDTEATSATSIQEDASPASVEVEEQVSDVTQAVELEDYNLLWVTEKYAKAVQSAGKGARAYLIYYVSDEKEELERLRQVIERGTRRLTEQYGLDAKNIVNTYGGYHSYLSVELWVVPAEAKLPPASPEEIPVLQEAPVEVEVDITEVPSSFRDASSLNIAVPAIR